MTFTGKKSTFTLLFFSLLTFLLYVGVAPAKAQTGVSSECTYVLLEKNFSLVEEHNISTLIYLNSIDEEQFNLIKEGVGANVPGYFSGDWNRFQKERQRLRQSIRLDTRVEQSRSALTSVSLPGAVEAWLECIRTKNAASVFVSNTVGSPDGTKFILNVTWKPDASRAGEPIKIVRSTVPGLKRGENISFGETGYEFTRPKADKDILLTVTGKSGRLNHTFSLYVPAYKPETPSIFPYFLGIKGLITCDTPGKNCFGPIIDGGFNSIFTPPRGNRDSKAEFLIPRGARFFKSRIGTFHCSQGSAFVFIEIDGMRVWPSPAPTSPNWPQMREVTLPIPEGAQRITLIANNAGNDWCDDVVWIDALFYREAK